MMKCSGNFCPSTKMSKYKLKKIKNKNKNKKPRGTNQLSLTIYYNM